MLHYNLVTLNATALLGCLIISKQQCLAEWPIPPWFVYFEDTIYNTVDPNSSVQIC